VTGRLIPPGAAEFAALFDSFTTEAFNLETLQSYGAAGEDDDVAAFLAGEVAPPVEHNDWLDMVRRNTGAGRVMRRVHLVAEPLSDYMRYELAWPYAFCTDAGEDIRVLPSLWPNTGDWWLFDSTRLYVQHHGADGTWLGTEPIDDPEAIRAARDIRDNTWARAVPWPDYIATHPDLAARTPTRVA
jgi:hypothetical protein